MVSADKLILENTTLFGVDMSGVQDVAEVENRETSEQEVSQQDCP